MSLFDRVRDLARRATGPRVGSQDSRRFNFERQVARHRERGLGPDAAREIASRETGFTPEEEASRGGATGDWLLDAGRDFKVALRSLRRAPGYSIVAILTLAIGIGATSAVYSVVQRVLLDPLPFPRAEELVQLYERTERRDRSAVTWPTFADWRERSRSFLAMTAYGGDRTTVIGGADPVRVPVYFVSRDFFDVVGVGPIVGRRFSPEESRPGGADVAIVSHRFWRGQLGGGDLGARRIETFGRSYSVVGVMPPSFDFPAGTDVWIPLEPGATSPSRTAHNHQVIARLRPGVGLSTAAAELERITVQLKREYPEADALGATSVALHENLVGPVRGHFLLLFGAVALVLVVACVNLAAANLARGTSRQHELAVRTALGAGRGRLVRQLVTESLVLAVAGAALGLLLARAAAGALAVLAPPTLPGGAPIAFDLRVLLVTLAVTVATGILVGAVPAFQVVGSDLRAAIGDARVTLGGRRARLLRGLVAAEVGLALVLVIGAGLLIRSLTSLLAQDPGFEPAGVVTIDYALPPTRYPEASAIARYHEAALAAVRDVPGVASAGLINLIPLRGIGFGGQLIDAERPPSEMQFATYRVVDADYFRTMGIPLINGRGFEATDDSTRAHVTLVNRTMAERFWPGQSPLGKRVRSPGMDRHPDQWLTVVGVVADVRHGSLAAPAGPEHYVYLRQRPERADAATIVVRTRGEASGAARRLGERLRSIDPEVPLELATMQAEIDRSVADRRFTTAILTTFAGVALGLAAIGIYGVLSYLVVQRTREIGIRRALGALRVSVVAVVLRDAAVPVAVGLAAGAVVAFAATRTLASLLFGVGPADPLSFGAAAVVLAAAAAVACLWPVFRAIRVDPMVALRNE